MKKILSALFSISVIAAIGVFVYFNQQFTLRQIDKVRGMYYVYKGDEAYRQMDMHKAIKLYKKGLGLFPGHYGAWYNLGNIYVAYEDYMAANHAYSEAFKHNPRMMVARMNYGIISSEKLGDFDTAISQYEKIIETERNLVSIPYVYNNRISFKQNKAIAYYNIGVSYRLKSLYSNDDWEIQRKYLSKAIEAYKKSLEIDPNSYDTQYNLGIAYHISGNYEDAGKAYCNAIKLSPMSFEAHYNLAILLRKMEHYKEAYDEIDKASTLITALNENSSVQEYAAIVMNDLTRSVYNNPNRQRLENLISEEEQNISKHIVKNNKKIKAKETKEDKFAETITSTGINFVNGRIVATEELDQAILNDFGQCPSMALFSITIDDEI